MHISLHTSDPGKTLQLLSTGHPAQTHIGYRQIRVSQIDPAQIEISPVPQL
ncbi:hypothetical protein GCM10007207_20170 [Asaia siamensis]|uniref:Uncharacterized protein n=1 Tax=Asaia siamensis TaxID=110479 RepID=A0ABQ1M4K1_9PROT|nr:hypothetical protein AA0323_1335 [Asaia siamensis NRIC 0323]GGC34605.1 hypothetical protein GCM10007207_20170 [Asaia siamensis]